MISKLLSSLLIANLAMGSAASATTLDIVKNQLGNQPFDTSVKDNDAIYAKYCEPADAKGITMPKYKGSPVYKFEGGTSNGIVADAAKILAKTKIEADSILRKNSEVQFQQNVEEIKAGIQTIIDSTKSAAVKANAQIVYLEVSTPGAVAINDNAKAAFGRIATELGASLEGPMGKLNKLLKEEIAGVNVKALKVIANDMAAGFKKDFKQVDFKKLATLVDQFLAVVVPRIEQLDQAKVISLTEQFLATIGENPTGDLKWAKEEADQLLTAAKTSKEELNKFAYTLNGLVWYFEDAIPKTAETEALLAGIKAEGAKTQAIQVQANLENLKASLAASPMEAETVSYQASDLVYTWDNLEESAPQIAGSTAEQKEQFSEMVVVYKGQVGNFQSQDLITNADNLVAQLAKVADDAQDNDEAKQNALSIASSMKWSLQDSNSIPASSATTKDAIAKFLGEIAKMESEQIITSAQDVVDALAKFENVLNDEVASAISNMSYYVNENIPVKDATKVVLLATMAIVKEINSWSNVNSYISSNIEMQESGHFYFYGGVKRMYLLGKTVPTAAANAGANKEAHWFLTQLCGEFRDRATMIEAKLNWVMNLVTLAKSSETVTNPDALAKSENVWKSVNASAYRPYLSLVDELWNARRSAQERYVKIGGIGDIDNPVKGTTVCETKYIFAKYVGASKEFDGLENFNKGYEAYKNDCLKKGESVVDADRDDLTDYFDFRGDSNFKHYSPESNGMIWYATSMAAACESMSEAKAGAKEYTSQDCQNYFARPYFYRYNAARSGLAAWLFRDQKHASTFSSQGEMVAIYPHRTPELAPFSFGWTDQSNKEGLFEYDASWLAIPGAWTSADIGFNGFTGLGTAQVTEAGKQTAYERIRDAVDRHTDWYSSGFNDGNGVAKNQAYSPFVASSYVMSASDAFTTCGITVSCPPDGLKRWMFVFRIKEANWYNPAKILENKPVNFDTMWFDETSFGVSGLADSENAWDRLGSAQEKELDSILYLINVNEGGEFVEGGEEGGD